MMTARQMALSLVDMRPRCPLCGQLANVLGQYSPFKPWRICRDCSRREPYPGEWIVPNTRRSSGSGIDLMVALDAPAEERERLTRLITRLQDAVQHRRKTRRYQGAAVRLDISVRQMQFPVCTRCGQVHGRMYETQPGQTDYWSLCQRCEDETRVEALWRSRAIFGGDDPEAILDRLYPSFPELFDRGVLPDYWFELMKGEVR